MLFFRGIEFHDAVRPIDLERRRADTMCGAPSTVHQVYQSDKPLSIGYPNVLLTIAVAIPRRSPFVGSRYLLLSAKHGCSGKIISITPQPRDATWQSPVPLPTHWSKLALLVMDVAAADVDYLSNLRDSCQVSLLERLDREEVAYGLVVSPNRKTTVAWEQTGTEESGLTVWFTGLSGAGKSTIATALECQLRSRYRVELLDADLVRLHLCKGLGYTEEDRRENVRRLAWLAKIFAQFRVVVLVSAISPYRSAREEARSILGRFVEVYVNAPLSVCETRDVKGLYLRARRGEIQMFTGIDDRYETPLNPEVVCCTDKETVQESVVRILDRITSEIDSACPATVVSAEMCI